MRHALDQHADALGDDMPSPLLRRPLRSIEQATRERAERLAREDDASTTAGLLVALDALELAARKAAAACKSERGRIACHSAALALDAARAQFVFARVQ